ncbi:MAG: MGMT family protein [Bacteroidetes bacterium]|nr:MGMT family protein [Bacteroidota bacterium]
MKSKKHTKNPDSFFEQVYSVARLIPKGRVTSYGAIARYLGTTGSSRMVGWAMNGAHSQKPRVPAQRVVNRNGLLTGKHHFGTPNLMQQLLENEGVRIENDVVVEFKKLFWDPSQELML